MVKKKNCVIWIQIWYLQRYCRSYSNQIWYFKWDRPLPKGKKIIGLMKDELGGKSCQNLLDFEQKLIVT